MVRSERRPGWLSLPEAAHAVPMSLPALRYVARHLAGPLEVRLDERGTAFIPASKLPLLRRVAAYRAQGHTIEQIKGLLRSEGAALPARAARPAERAHHQPAARPRPVPGLGQAFSSPSAPSPPEALSLPFPFPAAARANGRGEPGFQPQETARLGAADGVLPADTIEQLREEIATLHREQQELRLRLERLMLLLQEQQMGLEVEPLPRPPAEAVGVRAVASGSRAAAREPDGGSLAVEGMAAEAAWEGEARRPTRTPSSQRRPAVVRRWRPPVLNGTR